jgi:hypothetical protein
MRLHYRRDLAILSFLLCGFPLVLLLIVFQEPLFTNKTLFHPDWAPYFEMGSGFGFWRIFVEWGQVPSFMYFLWALLPDRLFHVLFYPVTTFAIWAVMYVFLRNRALPRAASMAGSLAGAFSGYLLTLVSAGHRGVTEAFLSCVIVLLCVDRLVRGGGVWFGVAAALATAFTLGTQPDVLVVIGMFVAAYAMIEIWHNRKGIVGQRQRFFMAVLVALVVFAIAVLPAISTIRNSFLPGRETEISRSVAASQGDVSAAERWEFVTNWSLPPADVPEFILPLFFGTETTDASAPFWGELGRSLGWEPGRPGMRNYRQHTVYIGLLQVLLALFACCVVCVKRCRRALLVSDDERRQIIFWSSCAVLALLLAFGRYTPVYRLFYVLPYANSIRAPIKFLHVVNLAVAILTAYGVTFLLRSFGDDKRQREAREVVQTAAKWLAMGAAGLAVILAVAALIIWGASASLGTGWSRMGYDPGLHPAMQRHMFLALWRSVALSAGLGLVIYWFVLRRKAPGRSATAFGCFLCFAIGTDMAFTARRFVRTADLSLHESRNAIVDHVKREVSPRIMDLLTSRQWHDPLRVNFKFYHAASVRLWDDDIPEGGALLALVGNDLNKFVRLLRLTGTEYVMGPRAQLAPWAATGSFALAGEFDFVNRIVPAGQGRHGREGDIVLLRVTSPLPRAAWIPSARVVPKAEMQRYLLSESFDPMREVLVDEDFGDIRPADRSGAVLAPAEMVSFSRWGIVLGGVPHEGGILLLNEAFHKDWRAFADGTPVPVRPANGVMMAIRVPAGTSQVRLLRQPGLRFFWLSTLPSFVLFLLTITFSFVWAIRLVRVKDIA